MKKRSPTIDRLEADVLVNAAAYTAVDRAEADVDTAFAAPRALG
jgi:dTDP-4-dehydrorhamnose reductase